MTSRQSSLRLKSAAFFCFAFSPLPSPLARHWQKVSSFAMIALVTGILMGTGHVSQCGAEDHLGVASHRYPNATVATPVDSSVPANFPARTPLWWDGRAIRSRSRVAGRKKVKRTRAEILREQRELLEKTHREIDVIVAEFHKKLPRNKAQSIGCAYCRYSSRFQQSIGDQVRKIFETACELGIYIPREHVFFDAATRGFKDRRPGLTAVREAIARKDVDVFMAFATSRVFRRAYKAQEFVEEQLVENGIRGIFLQPRIDTNGDSWRLLFQMLCAMDEAMVRTIGSHVRASHEGLFIRGMVCTSLPVGFTGEDVPGEYTKRKRPRQRIVKDAEAAEWIEKVYKWYVEDGMSMSEIARELNDDDEAPAPAKSLTGLWTQTLVRKHLLNPCYRGHWVYGATETKWLSKKDYAVQVPREIPLKAGYFENLQIVDDDLWYKAQDLLAKERAKSGRKTKKDDGIPRPRCLRGLFVCPGHGRQLVVGGPYGRVLFCPLCRAVKAEDRPLYTHLNRGLALRHTCQKLAELVRADDQLVAEIILACQREVETLQTPDPAVLNRLQARLDKVDSKIAFNRRNPGYTEGEQAATEKLLKELGAERAEFLADLAAHKSAQSRTINVPTPEQVLQMLAELGDILATAANSETDKDMRTVRRIIDELTGGRIELFQMGERKARRGWLKGTFTVRLLSFLVERITSARPSVNDGGTDFSIDYFDPPPIVAESERAKELYDQGLMNSDIATQMQCSRSRLTKVLKFWFESRSLVMPDGRSRRSALQKKHLKPPMYQQIADDVMVLYNQGMLLGDIAEQLGCDRNTVTSAIRWWHEEQGLPVTDGRTRRKELDVKSSPKIEDASSDTDDPQSEEEEGSDDADQ
ncbi:MAG: recombinase family protein [Planctomycetes bacterium]|nr:recombinase family protein [Planctomycetota bacterium]